MAACGRPGSNKTIATETQTLTMTATIIAVFTVVMEGGPSPL
jgi:hypothetical protein